MTETIFILVLAVTLAFMFGMIAGTNLERHRRQRAAIKEIDWMRPDWIGVPPPGPFDEAR